MRRHSWRVLWLSGVCLSGVCLMVAAVFVPPVRTWPAWGQPLVEGWREFASEHGWHGDPHSVSVVAVMLAGAAVVVAGLVASCRRPRPSAVTPNQALQPTGGA